MGGSVGTAHQSMRKANAHGESSSGQGRPSKAHARLNDAKIAIASPNLRSFKAFGHQWNPQKTTLRVKKAVVISAALNQGLEEFPGLTC